MKWLEDGITSDIDLVQCLNPKWGYGIVWWDFDHLLSNDWKIEQEQMKFVIAQNHKSQNKSVSIWQLSK